LQLTIIVDMGIVVILSEVKLLVLTCNMVLIWLLCTRKNSSVKMVRGGCCFLKLEI